MTVSDKTTGDGLDSAADEQQWPGIDSRYRLIVIAALRSKQLQRGATPRIAADPLRRRNTSIALEEVKRGLVPFTLPTAETKAILTGIDSEVLDERSHEVRGVS
ncbi:MAG TPA: DNA-directed RNA polymerase subunit omega [Pyrinomonadaceae bacterium]|jgi:DNA-directed RNA polymerase subunit omega